MEAVEKLKRIEIELDSKIKNINPKFVRTRWKARLLRIAVIAIGVATTIILGIEDIPWGKTAGFILSAILTGISSIEALFNHASKSVQEHDYYIKLTNLKQDISYYKEGKPIAEYKLEDVEKFFEEFKRIRTEFHKVRVDTVKISYENTKSKSS